ncbi:MAG: hypothetical protein AB1815_02380, partial [Bacillota bacterium]
VPPTSWVRSSYMGIPIPPNILQFDLHIISLITELIRPKTPASAGGGFQRAVKSSMDSANIQRGLNPPLNEVSFKSTKRVPV